MRTHARTREPAPVAPRAERPVATATPRAPTAPAPPIRNAVGAAMAHRATQRPLPKLPKTDAGIEQQRAGWQADLNNQQAIVDAAKTDMAAGGAKFARANRTIARDLPKQLTAQTQQAQVQDAKTRLEAQQPHAPTHSVLDGVLNFINGVFGGLRAVGLKAPQSVTLVQAIAWCVRTLRHLSKTLGWLSKSLSKAFATLGTAPKSIASAAVREQKALDQVTLDKSWLADNRLQPFGFDRTGSPLPSRRDAPDRLPARVLYDRALRGEASDASPPDNGKPLRAQPSGAAPASSRVYYGTGVYIDDHAAPDRSVPRGWSWVTLADGRQGYLETALLDTRLPCPGAKLHFVQTGETALAIAHANYGSTEKGRKASRKHLDDRFFVNVLQYVNQPSTMVGDPHDWAHVQFKAGLSIWVPPVDFALSLKGKVKSGSITRDLWSKARKVIDAASDMLIEKPAFDAGVVKGALAEVGDTAKSLWDSPEEDLKLLLSVVSGTILDQAEDLVKELKKLPVKQLGNEFLHRWFAKNPVSRGLFRGEVCGRLAVEAAIVYAGRQVGIEVLGLRYAVLLKDAMRLPALTKVQDAITRSPKLEEDIKRVAQASPNKPIKPPGGSGVPAEIPEKQPVGVANGGPDKGTGGRGGGGGSSKSGGGGKGTGRDTSEPGKSGGKGKDGRTGKPRSPDEPLPEGPKAPRTPDGDIDATAWADRLASKGLRDGQTMSAGGQPGSELQDHFRRIANGEKPGARPADIDDREAAISELETAERFLENGYTVKLRSQPIDPRTGKVAQGVSHPDLEITPPGSTRMRLADVKALLKSASRSNLQAAVSKAGKQVRSAIPGTETFHGEAQIDGSRLEMSQRMVEGALKGQMRTDPESGVHGLANLDRVEVLYKDNGKQKRTVIKRDASGEPLPPVTSIVGRT